MAVELTNAVPPDSVVTVHPAGKDGAVTPSKFSERVVIGTPTDIELVKEIGPRLLLTLKVRFS
ncbi:hypothetical protein OFC63_34325, partial [Escherichia coli]|nr:hypothetical protein [Escherichia coli]